MKTYAKNLWNRTQIVLKQSELRRQELSDFSDALSKRADAQQSYAKALQSSSKLIQKHIGENSLASLTFSAFRFGSNNRAAQARNLAKQLREEVISRLKQALSKQTTEYKSIQKQIKKCEKEFASLLESLNKSCNKYTEYLKECEEQLVSNQVVQVFSDTPKDKKAKMFSKAKETMKELNQYQTTAVGSIQEYNGFINKFYGDVERGLGSLEVHETERLDLQVDSIMKLLVFETSLVKNFQYDIANVSQQLEAGKSLNDIQNFIKQHELPEERVIGRPPMVQRSIGKESLLRMAEGKLALSVNLQRNTDMREFIHQSYKHDDLKSLKGFEDTKVEKFSTLSHMVWKCWQGEEISQQDIAVFKTLIQDQTNRHFICMCLQEYHLCNRVELNQKGFDYCTKMFLTLINKCTEKKDLFVIRKLLDMSFYYYKKQPIGDKQKDVANDGQESDKKSLQKRYLYREFDDISVFQSRQFWQASIFESVQQQLFILSHKPDPIQQAQTVRQKNTLLGQLASYCHHMIMMGVPVKQVRLIIGKFCRVYDIPEDQDRDLSRSIAAAVKSYKEIKGINSSTDLA